MSRDFLFEIGTEEMPARFMPPVLAELKDITKNFLNGYRLNFENVKTYGTPRRLTVYVEKLEEYQNNLEEKIKGPPQNVAYDANGNPTKAAEGFARSQGVNIGSLNKEVVDGVEYIFAVRKHEGGMTKEILPQLCPRLIDALSFPKAMRWGSKDVRFARPIRWLTSLYGEEAVEFNFHGIKSKRYSRGHRFLSNKRISISSPEVYFESLKSAYVIADQDERRQMIWKQINDLADNEGGCILRDDDLLEEVNFLLEYPTALCGNFSKEFLELPDEVLITSMREHQRYFSIYDSDERMLPKFITVRNGTGDNIEIVREGNERVLDARLRDAQFFYDEDRKTSLENKVDKLKFVVFQEELGSVFDKCKRLQNITMYLTGILDLKEFESDTYRAAYLCKADLVTNMVKEFSDLQGIIGYYYAVYDGENEAVCEAVKEHYKPRSASDFLPEHPCGALLSIADKMDNIIGCFSVGIQPTGSQDPYALRRQAFAICKIISENNYQLSLLELFRRTYEEYTKYVELKLSYMEVEGLLKEFFQQRIGSIFEEKGISYDVINAVMEKYWEDISDSLERAKALMEFRKNPEFDSLIVGYTRAANLAQKTQVENVDTTLLEEEEEKRLFESFENVKERVSPHIYSKDYIKILTEIAALREPIDSFFDNVMVMVEDEKIKNNRLALLKSISSFMSTVGDLKKIVPSYEQ